MRSKGEREYQNRSRVIATQRRRVYGLEAKRRVERALHGVVAQTPVPKSEALWFYDLRRGRLRIYGALLRYIDVAVLQGVRKSTLHVIPQVLAAYIDDVAPDEEGQPNQAA